MAEIAERLKTNLTTKGCETGKLSDLKKRFSGKKQSPGKIFTAHAIF